MHKIELTKRIELFKNLLAEKRPNLSHDSYLPKMLTHLQAFIVGDKIQQQHDYAAIDYHDFMNFLQQQPERLAIWKSSLADKHTTATELFWDSPVADIVDHFVHLRLIGIEEHTLDIVRNGLLLSRSSTFYDDFKILLTTLKKINHYHKRFDALTFSDLACLSNSHTAIERIFTKHGIKPDTINAFGEYPIHLATLSNMRLQVAQALTLGCDINQTTNSGQKFSDNKAATALHYAARYNYRDMALFLLENGADDAKADVDGKLPIDWAREADANDVVELLETYASTLPNTITIYIELGIHSERFDKTTVRELEKYGNKLMLKEEMRDQDSINFQDIARRLTCASAHGPMQVGETLEDMVKMVEQHSYYKYGAAFYGVKLQVRLDDLEGPYSEQDLIQNPDVINARDEKYWVLKANTHISADNIQSITLWDDRWPSLPKVKECSNPKLIQTSIRLTNHTEYLCKQLRSFLRDEEFWENHVYGFRQYVDMPLFPSPILQMQALCDSFNNFTLHEFQKIAAANCPNEYKGVTGYAYSFFSADNVTKRFYRAIMQASNLYDVMSWIIQNRSSPAATSMPQLVRPR